MKLKATLTAALLGLVTLAVNADTQVETPKHKNYHKNGDFVVTIDSNEPFAIWRTTDFVTWTNVSGTLGKGKHKWKDHQVGKTIPYAFYKALPATKDKK